MSAEYQRILQERAKLKQMGCDDAMLDQCFPIPAAYRNAPAPAPQVFRAVQRTPQLSPLEQERLNEENSLSTSASIVASISYTYDSDGDFQISFRTRRRGDICYVVAVIMNNKGANGDRSYRETRAIATVLKLASRGEQIDEGIFLRWGETIKSKTGATVTVQRQAGVHVALICRFEPITGTYGVGFIRGCSFGHDSDKDIIVKFRTDAEQFVLIVKQVEINNSVSKFQAIAFAEVLLVAEPGDKMDESIFLQFCAQFKKKYHVLNATRNGPLLVGHIIPTMLPESQAGVSFKREGQLILPPVLQGAPGWSEATVLRVEYSKGRHMGVMCDGCGVDNIKGKRYKCKQCYDYDLCQGCKDNGVQTKSHARSHAMDAMDPPDAEGGGVSVLEALMKLMAAAENGNGQANPTQPPSNGPTGSGGVHKGIVCKGCGTSDFPGKRHSCGECSGYDLCGACFDANTETHGHLSSHLMRTVMPPAAASTVHSGITCNACGKKNFPGKRHHCGECPGDYNLCDDCFNNDRETHSHKHTHLMRTLLTPTQSAAPAIPPAGRTAPVYGGLPEYDDGASKYQASKVLVRSGQADVFEGHEITKSGSRKDVAIKVYHNEEDWRDCKTEVKALLKINHRNVMSVIDFFETPKPCIIMRLVRGLDLMQYLKKNGRFDLNNGTKVLVGIAAGLQHLHEHGLIHRDMKSPNVLIEEPSLTPVIIDLGLGKAKDTMSSGSMIESRGPMGTLLWMAPEMYSDAKYSEKTDIFALGIMMWETFTGLLPYSHLQRMPQLISYVFTNDGRPEASDIMRVPGMPQSHVDLMTASWAKSAANRPTAAQFVVRAQPGLAGVAGPTIAK